MSNYNKQMVYKKEIMTGIRSATGEITKAERGRQSACNELLCCDCKNPAVPPFMIYGDNRMMCEACAIAEYKAKHPLTWDM